MVNTIKTLITILTILGTITYYPSIEYSGKPLFCGDVYRDDLEWIALPQGTDFECFDSILVRFDDGNRMVLPVMDTGTFGNNCVVQDDNECLAIIADLPEHVFPYKGLSKVASILNLSRLNRLRPDMMVGYLRE